MLANRPKRKVVERVLVDAVLVDKLKCGHTVRVKYGEIHKPLPETRRCGACLEAKTATTNG